VTSSTSPEYNVGDIAGGFVISNSVSGISIYTEIPTDDDYITEAYFLSLTFNDLFTNPSSDNLTFTSTLTSELGDVDVQEFIWALFHPTTACGDLVSHEGYDYSTVQIGEQCWFSENCRYLPSVSEPSDSSSTVPHYYVYDYSGGLVIDAIQTSNYLNFGVLYNWPAVMTINVCPNGWHIPSDDEWQTLEMELGMSEFDAGESGYRGTDEGVKLKSTYGWSNNWNGTNSSGFTGLPAGWIYDAEFHGQPDVGLWWTNSEYGGSSWQRGVAANHDDVERNLNGKEFGNSARCVRD
jgi:uncharacterized protein (TIGR02145 family)